MKIKNLKLKIYILVTSYLLMVIPVLAQSPIPIGEKFGFGNITSLGEATSKLVTPAFSITAVMVIMYFLFGAFRYLRAGGNKEEMEGARQMITHAIIGFFILMSAFLVLQFLLSSLFGITGFQIIR
ncbi:hypothetical protein HYZ06_00955 [Candidatus Daviesbacteria bacterium]|nr:hypothetical protein [Candidatus Daviesbacteria bacterium]